MGVVSPGSEFPRHVDGLFRVWRRSSLTGAPHGDIGGASWAGEAAELAGLLSFLGGWLVSGGEALAASLGRFAAGHGYDVAASRSDLARLAFLLTGEDGQRLSAANRAMRRDPVAPGPALDR